MIYINHSFHNGFFHRVFDGSTAPRMRAQYSHLSHRVRPWFPRAPYLGHYTVFGSWPGHPGKPTRAPPGGDCPASHSTSVVHSPSNRADRNVLSCGERSWRPGSYALTKSVMGLYAGARLWMARNVSTSILYRPL